MKNPAALLCASLLVVFVAGCAATPAPSRSPQPSSAKADQPRSINRNLSGYSVAFKQGYVAGCDSAGSGIRRRDEGRYKVDADYTMGWNDGYSGCRR